MTSTIPATLTTALASQGAISDSAVGLVHLGQGRFYDPMLGRPLQPNPMGGPPSVPQALNRYAATSVGQPGVAQVVGNTATPNSNFIFTAFRDTSLQTALGYGAGKAIETTAWGPLSITTSQYGWRQMGQMRSLFQPGAKAREIGKTFRTYTTLGRVRMDQGQYLTEAGEIVDTASLPASARIRFIPRFSPLVRTVLGAGAAFGISAIFQGIEDWNDPFLTSDQRTGRVVVSGFGGTAGWYAGLITTEVAAGAGAGSWAGPIGIVVGATVTFVWIVWVQPTVFDARDLNPERNLAPLQN